MPPAQQGAPAQQIADACEPGKVGNVSAAMAYRAKYRVSPSKRVLRLENTGVHKENRGRLYPSGEAVKRLCESVFTKGFIKEEVVHALVAVEEPPLDEIIKLRSAGTYRTGLEYNEDRCSRDEFLQGCFKSADPVLGNLLSHNHILLVLRAFVAGAKWDIPEIGSIEPALRLCSDDGRLMLSALKDHTHGVQAHELISDGLPVEMLSWKMDIEEPTAASIISQSLNIEQELALRTSELTAVAILKGEMIVQMGKDISQKVAYKSVIA